MANSPFSRLKPATVAAQAQWFEDNSSIDDAHKKKEVVGISAKVITIVAEGGDAAPPRTRVVKLTDLRRELGVSRS